METLILLDSGGTKNEGRPSGSKEAELILLDPLPTPENCPNWRRDFRKSVAACSTNPSQAFQWVSEVEHPAMNWTRLGEIYPFVTLDVKRLQALSRVRQTGPGLQR